MEPSLPHSSQPVASQPSRVQRRLDPGALSSSVQWAHSQRSRMSTLLGTEILGVGSYAPPEVVDNHDLAMLGYDPEWIIQRTGIRERRHAPEGVAASDLALEASQRCLADAGVAASEVDLIVCATMTPDTPTPSAACHLQRRLGCKAAAMDVNAACAGFMYALVTAMHFVAGGGARRALVVGVDLMSRTVYPDQKKTYPLFGDGAGAVLVGCGDSQQGLLSYTLGAEGEGADLLYIPAGGSREPVSLEKLKAGRHYLEMDGRAVFKWAVRLLVETIHDTLEHAELTAAEIDHFVLHQANTRILDAAAENLGIAPEKMVVNLDRYGNTSAASIPLALDDLNAAQQLKPGKLVLLCGFGAGLSWGTAIMRW